MVPHAILSMLKEMSGSSSTYTFAALSSQLEATTVIDGLVIETQSYQNFPKNSPAARDSFKVILQ